MLSGIWRSPPWGAAEPPDFLNAVVCGLTALDAGGLACFTRSLESEAGSPLEKNGMARLLDVDILFLDPPGLLPGNLVLPHPRMHLRRFVLEPLREVLPSEPLPGLGVSAGSLLASCPDQSHIIRVVAAPPPGRLWL